MPFCRIYSRFYRMMYLVFLKITYISMGVLFTETVEYPMIVPKAMLPYLDYADKDRSTERLAMMLYPYIRDLTISHGRAAEIIGMNKLDLIDLYCEMGLPYINQSASDLDQELAEFHDLME